MTYKYGCWWHNGILYKNKIEALRQATIDPTNLLLFYYHDKVWSTYDLSTLGKRSLETLYKERALQLRDRYDYLVLHYSGGSDSHNILQTFIKNNIKLDEVTVRWAKPLTDGKFYNANRVDKSPKNSPSEWDYVIKPELDKLKLSNPEIKINIVDFTETISASSHDVKYLENRILNINSSRGALGSIAMRLDEDHESKLTLAPNKKTGHIFGIEKPMLFIRNNKLYFYFTDTSFDAILMANMEEEDRAEPFYWCPDFPELTMEQVYQVGLYFKLNPDKINLLNNDTKSIPDINIQYRLQQVFLKNILYGNTWDPNKFQVDKPNIDRSDWYYWIHESPELRNLNLAHHQAMKNITSSLGDNVLINTDRTPLLKPYRTRLFYLMDL